MPPPLFSTPIRGGVGESTPAIRKLMFVHNFNEFEHYVWRKHTYIEDADMLKVSLSKQINGAPRLVLLWKSKERLLEKNIIN